MNKPNDKANTLPLLNTYVKFIRYVRYAVELPPHAEKLSQWANNNNKNDKNDTSI